MALEQLQHALARLYTDAVLRAEFLADPHGTSTALGLSSNEAEQIAAISAEQIELFSLSLRRKRADQVRSLLPYTCRALGKSFEHLFASHTQCYSPRSCHKHRDDALQFADYLCQNARDENVATEVIDIARFESAALKMSQSTDRVLVRLFRHDVRRAIREIDDGHPPYKAAYRPSVGIWFRIGPMARLRFVVFPPSLSLSSRPSKLITSHERTSATP